MHNISNGAFRSHRMYGAYKYNEWLTREFLRVQGLLGLVLPFRLEGRNWGYRLPKLRGNLLMSFLVLKQVTDGWLLSAFGFDEKKSCEIWRTNRVGS